MRLVQMRIVLVAFVFVAVLAARASDATACSCTDTPLADHAKAATQVLLVRAGAPVRRGAALEQTFTVLATLKGTATKTFVLDRKTPPPCASSYADGEVAILFASGGGELSPCNGNVPMASQIEQLLEILDATGAKRSDAKAPAIEAALRSALAPYTHDRPRIPVAHAPLAKTTWTVGKSSLVVGAKGSKDAIVITRAIAAGTLSLVTGRYDREGVWFTVLLQGTTVVWSSVVER